MSIPGPPSFQRRSFLVLLRWKIKSRNLLADVSKWASDFLAERWRQIVAWSLLFMLACTAAYLCRFVDFAFAWELCVVASLITIRSTFSTSVPAIARDIIVPVYILCRLYGKEIVIVLKTKRHSAGRYAIEGAIAFFLPFFAYNFKLVIDDINRKSVESGPPIIATLKRFTKPPLPPIWALKEPAPNPPPSSPALSADLLFKDSPLFTEERQQRIKQLLGSFKAYFVKVGVYLPNGIIPILSDHPKPAIYDHLKTGHTETYSGTLTTA